MNNNDINEITSNPYWIASTKETDYPSLDRDLDIDVAIVGGGLVGIVSAYLLKKEGYHIGIFECDRIGKGTSGHTTAKITSQHDLIYDKIAKNIGTEAAKQYADSNESAIKLIRDIINENNIDCDFMMKSSYVYTQDDKYIQKILDEALTAKKLGIKAFYLDSIPLPFPVKAAVRFDDQAQFHPRKYLLALAEKIPDEKNFIFEQTKIMDIKEGIKCVLESDKGYKIKADYVIVSTHYPFYEGMGMYFARMYAEKSYAISLKIDGILPNGMFITAENPGRSIRTQPYNNGEMIIIGGEHHKTGQGENTNRHYENLFKFANDNFKVTDILYKWSTQDYMTLDDIPYIGRIASGKDNIFVSTGFKKWGMTTSHVSAMIFKDLIVKGESPWEKVYSPLRFTPSPTIVNFIKQNADVAKQLVTGKLEKPPKDIDVKNGEAKVFSYEGQRVGAYKDIHENMHLVDTTCTHMGCEVKWNEAEKSWDCPCHGSRFTYDGDIIEGPAMKPLSKFNENNTNSKKDI